MPEYLAPGVFVDEISLRHKTIQGVGTSTTGFIGPTRLGPEFGEPALLTSFSDFERIYGGLDPLRLGTEERVNYLAFAVRNYFDEGGERLYVARVIGAGAGTARWVPDASSAPGVSVAARYAGAAGNGEVHLVMRLSDNLAHDGDGDSDGDRDGNAAGGRVLRGVRNRDTLIVTTGASRRRQLCAVAITGPLDDRRTELRDANAAAVAIDEVTHARLLTVDVRYRPDGRFADEMSWEGVSPDPGHRNSLTAVFAPGADAVRRTVLDTPLVIEAGDGMSGAAIVAALLDALGGGMPDDGMTLRLPLTLGSDGSAPQASAYRGRDTAAGKSGLEAFSDLEEISIVAAPGSTAAAVDGAVARGIRDALIAHCERMRYRVAVLDSIENDLPNNVGEYRGEIDSTRAALYYPWVCVADPLSGLEPRELALPPSGFIAGIYARSDVERGVHKPPANEIIRTAASFTFLVTRRQQDVLNPLGVNCLRFLEGRGNRVWGARTATSDPEWKYVNVRRYFAYLERSIEKGTQWAVFEPNGSALWANVQRTVENFLHTEFVSGHLAGRKPQEAFFVRCDETTITQSDRDNGRLVCLVGVAALRPAEFIIFRINHKTVDSPG